MLCCFKLILGHILLYVLKRLLFKTYMTYKADLFYYTQDLLCYIIINKYSISLLHILYID